MVNIIINQQKLMVNDGLTVLQAARETGIIIPTLCDHPDLHPFGGCRLCVVEVKGTRIPMTACTLHVVEGMEIKTESASLTKERKMVLELLLSEFSETNNSKDLDSETEFTHWIKYYGLDHEKWKSKNPKHSVDSDPNPFIRVDLNKCIICTRCIRACAEIQGRFVWNLAYRGIDTQIIAGAGTNLLEGRCESCGACVAYCPTGALENRMSYDSGKPDRLVTTTCTYCGVGCQFDLNVKDERIIRVTSNRNAPVNGMHLCVKGRYGYDFIHHPDRLLKPKVRKYILENSPKPANRGDWVEVDWETALGITAQRLASYRDDYGSDSIGILTSAKCLNEENYLMNKFSRQVIGTNSIDHCARL